MLQESLGFNMKKMYLITYLRFEEEEDESLSSPKDRERRFETQWRNCPEEYPWEACIVNLHRELSTSRHVSFLYVLDETSCSHQPRFF